MRLHSIARPQNIGAMRLKIRHLLDDRIRVRADHVMRHHAFEPAEPPRADLRQHRALHRDRLRHHDVEGADAVGGEQQHAVVADGIDIAHLAAPDPWQGQIAGKHRGHERSLRAERPAEMRDTGEGISSLRQRNELMFLRNGGKSTGFPVLFGLLDPLLAGGDEIPPDVPRALPAHRRPETSSASAWSSSP